MWLWVSWQEAFILPKLHRGHRKARQPSEDDAAAYDPKRGSGNEHVAQDAEASEYGLQDMLRVICRNRTRIVIVAETYAVPGKSTPYRCSPSRAKACRIRHASF